MDTQQVYCAESTLHTATYVYLPLPLKPTQVYCEMDLDGGGWTLVWKHSPMQVPATEPLSDKMKHGGVFVDYSKVVDYCKNSSGVQPYPSTSDHACGDLSILGIYFDKTSPYDARINCDLYHSEQPCWL